MYENLGEFQAPELPDGVSWIELSHPCAQGLRLAAAAEQLHNPRRPKTIQRQRERMTEDAESSHGKCLGWIEVVPDDGDPVQTTCLCPECKHEALHAPRRRRTTRRATAKPAVRLSRHAGEAAGKQSPPKAASA